MRPTSALCGAAPARRRRRSSRSAIGARDRVWSSGIVDVRRLGHAGPQGDERRRAVVVRLREQQARAEPVTQQARRQGRGDPPLRRTPRRRGADEPVALDSVRQARARHARRPPVLKAGDYVNMSLELLVLPRRATGKRRSATCTPLAKMPPSPDGKTVRRSDSSNALDRRRASRSETSCLGCAHRSGWRRRRGAASSASPPRRALASRATTRFAWPPPRKVA